MKLLSWLMGGLLYLAFLTVTAPASALFWLASHFASPGITTTSTSGTLWRGEAQDVSFTPPGGKPISLERLTWNFHPLELVLGRLALEIEFSGARTKGRSMLRLTPSRLNVLLGSDP